MKNSHEGQIQRELRSFVSVFLQISIFYFLKSMLMILMTNRNYFKYSLQTLRDVFFYANETVIVIIRYMDQEFLSKNNKSVKTITNEHLKTKWVDNDTDQTSNDYSQKQSIQVDQNFKKQHQLYLNSRINRRLEQQKKKIQEFGHSSSDQDIDKVPVKEENIEIDENFKKQHQNYVSDKIKKRMEEHRQKIQKFGQSSSEEDENLKIVKSKLFIRNQQQFKASDIPIPPKPKRNVSQKQSQHSLSKSVKIGHASHIENHRSLDIMVSSKKGVDVWIEQKLTMKEKTVVVAGLQCAFYDINKLKLIFTDVGDRCFKLKINWKSQQFIFAASYKKMHENLPDAYFIFASIIAAKLNIMVKKLTPVPQLKPQGIPDILIKNSFIYGKLYKRSRVLGRWSEIFAVINRQGFYYYKKINDKGELLIPRPTITELWTRFQFQEDRLVIKLFQNSHKIELGIPVYDYLSPQSWLYYFYGLIFKNN